MPRTSRDRAECVVSSAGGAQSGVVCCLPEGRNYFFLSVVPERGSLRGLFSRRSRWYGDRLLSHGRRLQRDASSHSHAICSAARAKASSSSSSVARARAALRPQWTSENGSIAHSQSMIIGIIQ
eukprot:Amastigsp_a676420_142.p1 type:complete len:124 gc:universal Amastigsp_a676420_142:477-106(-)